VFKREEKGQQEEAISVSKTPSVADIVSLRARIPSISIDLHTLNNKSEKSVNLRTLNKKSAKSQQMRLDEVEVVEMVDTLHEEALSGENVVDTLKSCKFWAIYLSSSCYLAFIGLF